MKSAGRRGLFIAVVLLAVGRIAGAATEIADRWMPQSGFWVSLHETLLHATQIEPVPLPEAAVAAERDAWSATLDFCRADSEERFAVFDDELAVIGHELSRSPEDEPSEELPAGVEKTAHPCRLSRPQPRPIPRSQAGPSGLPRSLKVTQGGCAGR